MHVRMFRREVQTLARLKHPGIAAIYESGRTPDGQHFFAVELVRGETLREYLERTCPDGTLSPGEVKERLVLLRDAPLRSCRGHLRLLTLQAPGRSPRRDAGHPEPCLLGRCRPP